MADTTLSQSKTLKQPVAIERPPRRIDWGKGFVYAVLILGIIFAIAPFLWMLSASLMTTTEISTGRLIPAEIQWDNYPTALRIANFLQVSTNTDPELGDVVSSPERTLWITSALVAFAGVFFIISRYLLADKPPRILPSLRPLYENKLLGWVITLILVVVGIIAINLAVRDVELSGYLWNSLRLTTMTIVGSLIVNIPAAYAFGRMRFFGRDFMFALMLSTMMIPAIVTLVPHLLTVIWVGRFSESIFGPNGAWFNNWPALVVPGLASAFNIFLLRQFFTQIPDDLWDAARIDGAGHFRFLMSVVLPLSKAPIMTVVTLEFIGAWNSLMWPLLVTNDETWRPVAVGLTNFVTGDAPGDLHLQMAASVLMILPILVIYFIAQKQFTEGIAQSGLKG